MYSELSEIVEIQILDNSIDNCIFIACVLDVSWWMFYVDTYLAAGCDLLLFVISLLGPPSRPGQTRRQTSMCGEIRRVWTGKEIGWIQCCRGRDKRLRVDYWVCQAIGEYAVGVIKAASERWEAGWRRGRRVDWSCIRAYDRTCSCNCTDRMDTISERASAGSCDACCCFELCLVQQSCLVQTRWFRWSGSWQTGKNCSRRPRRHRREIWTKVRAGNRARRARHHSVRLIEDWRCVWRWVFGLVFFIVLTEHLFEWICFWLT